MTTPLVSIIIPVYNRLEDLKSAIASALTQSFQDYEIIIVDDASPSPIPQDIITDKRFRLIRLKYNCGAAAARNEGIRHAKGTYIAFLDSDDTWDPEYLETQINTIKDLPLSYGGSVTGFRIKSPNLIRSFSPSLPENLFLYFLGGCFISPGSALIVRKDIFKNIGFFNEKLRRLEDWEWLLRFSKKYALFPISGTFVNIHYGEFSSSPIVFKSLKRLKNLARPLLKHKPLLYKRRFLAAIEVEKASIAIKNKWYLLSFLFLLKGAFYDFKYIKGRLSLLQIKYYLQR